MLPGLYGETGWHKLKYYRQKDMIRFWLRLYNMNNQRFTKKIFVWWKIATAYVHLNV